jgi:hypothetical protein
VARDRGWRAPGPIARLPRSEGVGASFLRGPLSCRGHELAARLDGADPDVPTSSGILRSHYALLNGPLACQRLHPSGATAIQAFVLESKNVDCFRGIEQEVSVGSEAVLVVNCRRVGVGV